MIMEMLPGKNISFAEMLCGKIGARALFRVVLLAFFAGILPLSFVCAADREMFSVKKTFSAPGELVSDKVTAIAIDSRYVFVGTDSGLSVYDKSADEWSVMEKLSVSQEGKKVRKIALLDNTVWLLNDDSLRIFDTDRQKFVKVKKELGAGGGGINDIAISGVVVYLATTEGLIKYDTESGDIRVYDGDDGFPENNVIAVAVRGSFVFAGCPGSPIYRLNFDGERFISFSPEEPYFANPFLEFAGTALWCGTNGKGLRVFSVADENWSYHSMQEGLSDDFVQALAGDGSVLWVGTFGGLNRYDINEGKWSAYSTENGLPDRSITAIGVDGNYIWVGTDAGLALVNKFKPQVVISDRQNFITEKDISEKVVFDCSVIDASPIMNVSASWSIGSFTGIWSSEQIKVSKLDKKRRCVIEWNIKKLPSFNDVYFVKLQALNSLGFKNEDMVMMRFDAVNPIVTIDPVIGALEPGPYKITGVYNKSGVREIVVNPGGIKAVLDPGTYSYSAMINLESGINILEVKMVDQLGRESTELVEIDCGLDEAPMVTMRDEDSIVPESEDLEVLLTKETIEAIMPKKIFISEMILFEPGSVKIKMASFPFLENLAAILKKNSGLKVRVEGYAYMEDVSGTPFKDNKELSAARALIVGEYLQNNGDVNRERMKLVGLSSNKVLVTPKNKQDEEVNRRVEIHLSSE